MRFWDFIITEDRRYLGQQLGDILSALQSLASDADNLGNRQLIRGTQGIVSQIRRILHDSWPDSEEHTLKTLQKVGVALAKGIDTNEDLRQVIATSVQILQKSATDLGAPINDLGPVQ